jgi:hypothetical protein
MLLSFTNEQQCLRANKIKRNIGKARLFKDTGDIEALFNLFTDEVTQWDDIAKME